MKQLLAILSLTVCTFLEARVWPWSGRADIEALRADYIAPRTSIGEPETDWEPVLKPIAERLAADARTPLEAAMALNRGIFRETGVIYSTKRDYPNQDPLHSIRIGMASCSGLSIMLVDACRSIGIPARVVGCMWVSKPGNHTWVEIWDGDWYPLGAIEDSPPDKLWFLDDASEAIADDPRYAIYAARGTPSPGGTLFYGWNVPADNVTARYTARRKEADGVRVHIAAERGGERVAVPFTVAGQTYVTPGPRQDMNDYATLTLPEGASFTVEIEGKRLTYTAEPDVIRIIELNQ